MLALAFLLAAIAAETTYVKDASSLRVVLPRVAERPVLDGVLDDTVWRSAAQLTDFVQFEPGDQVPASQPSVGYLAYDADYLYFAFRAFEEDRSRVRATVFPRERGGEFDDRVTLILDTFHDRRRAYEFKITPRGIQADAIKTEGQRGDHSPDFVWYSTGRIVDDGWIVEAMIPWASLRFPATEPFEMGVNVARVFGRTGEKASWAPRRRGNVCDICQEGVLVGLRGIDRSRTVDLLPYVAGTRSGARQFALDSMLVDGEYHRYRRPGAYTTPRPMANVGGDLRFALTPAFVLNGTLNPDFSQVESDEEQIRTNQRFALFLQERRPFFLEGRDAFAVGSGGDGGRGEGGGGGLGELFYSRAIVDPSAGARLTGKQGAYTVGTLYARDAVPAYFHYDGHERSGVVPRLAEQADVLVARARRDVLADSYVGVLGLGRRSGEMASGVAATDFSLRRGHLTLSGELAMSHDRAPLDSAAPTGTVDGAPTCDSGYRPAPDGSASCVGLYEDGETRRGGYYRMRLARAGNRLRWSLAAAGVSPDFRNQLGRFGRVGIEEYSGRLVLFQYPNNGVLQRVEQSISVSRTNAYRGGLLDYEISPRVELQFQRQTSLMLGVKGEHITLDGTPLDVLGGLMHLRSNASQRVAGGIFLFAGQREIYDRARPRVGTGYIATVQLVVRPTAASSVEARAQRSLHREGWGAPVVGDARIVRLRGTYQFTRALGVRLITEHSDQLDALQTNPLARRTVRLGTSALLTYELAPASFLFVGYGDARQDFDAPAVPAHARLRTESQLFLKLSYLLRL